MLFTRHGRAFPHLVARLLGVAALLIVLHTVFQGTKWLAVLTFLFSGLLIPIELGGLGWATMLAILALALHRRKRAGWVVATLVLAAIWLVEVAVAGILIWHMGTGVTEEMPTARDIAPYAVNIVTLGFLIVLLLAHRQDFPARTTPGNRARAAVALVIGLAVSAGVSTALVTVFGGEGHRRNRVLRLLGNAVIGHSAEFLRGPAWAEDLIGVLVSASFAIAFLLLLRSQRAAAVLPLADELAIRDLLAAAESDSLSYFATRRDKSAVFSPTGQAAVTYRSQVGVCLASGDPVGPPNQWPAAIAAWVRHAHSYGLSPGVIGASEAGARAYTDAGLRALRVGDEAILVPSRFDLEAGELRGVRTTVRRLERLGYTVRARRHRDVSAAEWAELQALASTWRGGEEERGFSMALGRLGDPLDGDCLLVEALFPSGDAQTGVAGLLSFVPWGRRGVSLDIMRRSPDADNGVTELMVAGLMARARDLRVDRVSLNFAVFRSALEEGAQVGATPLQRFQRRALLVASRWFQIEQLYRSNVKYAPQWQPRFLCYENAADIATVGLAMGIAEGFVELPGGLVNAPQRLVDLTEAPEAAAWLARHTAVDEVVAPSRPLQVQHRLGVRDALLAAGIDPYPVTFRPDTPCVRVADLADGTPVRVAGRVLAIREHGGVAFLDLEDSTGRVQVVVERALAPDALGLIGRLLGRGDHCGVTGRTGQSRTGTASVIAESVQLTSKALRPPPDPRRGVTDPEVRVRQPYLTLLSSASARERLAVRSRAIQAVRHTLIGSGFLEVETPVLQTVHGGANARPFHTHINAYDLELYLRIAPELYLKRLMVGGMDRVFEIGRNYRNEGADATHNPEFTMLEAYEAYGDYTTMRELTQRLIRTAAADALGTTVVRGRDDAGRVHDVDLAEPWRVVTVNDAISEASGHPVTAATPRDDLVRLAESLRIPIDPRWSRGAVVLELYEHLVEHRTVAPTFYCDFPAEVSPLTRPHRRDPRLAERWDLVVFGAEIGTAYSELVDPVIQRERLTAQSLQAADGDPEAMELDEDFLTALEYAMPPSGGLGMGLDRLVMMLTDASIREVIAFPLVRPKQ
ncbi:MAG TPA: bifunctional lysylphosphatidylglycerol synthetase/lysine--tRNA ligase LysX [Propionibacteriaceae bacterium]|nr:bifunctional lysylphosphatidylglycerol synthetase/lysine--tRNA ligase LysX [Propionibacteriaceae bacterium]